MPWHGLHNLNHAKNTSRFQQSTNMTERFTQRFRGMHDIRSKDEVVAMFFESLFNGILLKIQGLEGEQVFPILQS